MRAPPASPARTSSSSTLPRQLRGASARQAIHAAAASAVALRPPALQQATALEPVERRVDRSLGEVERTVAPRANGVHDRVAVRRAALQRRQQEQIDVSLQYLGLHRVVAYA